jgi:hypothetical protein
MNSGASLAGLPIELFSELDTDIKNFYINQPKGDDGTGSLKPMTQILSDRVKAITTKEDLDSITSDILSSVLPESVKHYLIEQLPIPPEEKKSLIEKIWSGLGILKDKIF